MKITDVEVITFRTTTIHRRSRWGFLLWDEEPINTQQSITKISTDEGVYGYMIGGDSMITETRIKPLLVGEDPLDGGNFLDPGILEEGSADPLCCAFIHHSPFGSVQGNGHGILPVCPVRHERNSEFFSINGKFGFAPNQTVDLAVHQENDQANGPHHEGDLPGLEQAFPMVGNPLFHRKLRQTVSLEFFPDLAPAFHPERYIGKLCPALWHLTLENQYCSPCRPLSLRDIYAHGFPPGPPTTEEFI